MILIDLISLATFAICLYALFKWFTSLNNWPLRWAVAIALLSNIAFLVVRFSSLLSPADLNLLSAARVLLTVLVIAVIPSSVKNKI